MSPQTYLVHMPRAEARYLAGVSVSWPATPEARCVHAVREWLNGIRGRRAEQVPVQKIIQDLDPLLRQVPPAERPQHGPLAGRGAGTPMSGCVEYLGGGIVRLDEDAISSLASLAPDDDFHVIRTDAGPVLSVGADRYLAHEELPDSKA